MTLRNSEQSNTGTSKAQNTMTVKREELLKTPEYWFEQAQNELYRQVTEFMREERINQTQLAEKLGVSKGYISQIMKGEFNYTLKKLIELSMAIGKVPRIDYKDINDVINEDNYSNRLYLTESKKAKC